MTTQIWTADHPTIKQLLLELNAMEEADEKIDINLGYAIDSVFQETLSHDLNANDDECLEILFRAACISLRAISHAGILPDNDDDVPF